jgi:hypothetical protein
MNSARKQKKIDIKNLPILFHYYYTVKLGYNDHGYNELTFIANKFGILVWFSTFLQ